VVLVVAVMALAQVQEQTEPIIQVQAVAVQEMLGLVALAVMADQELLLLAILALHKKQLVEL
jgi:hypothetical protein